MNAFNPDLQKTVEALEETERFLLTSAEGNIDDLCYYHAESCHHALTLLKAQQEEIEQLTDRLEAKVHGYNKLFNELQAQQWVSVEDRLPEIGQEFLGAYGENYSVDHWGMQEGGAWNRNSCNWNDSKHLWKHVTHWMPLPAPPQTGNRE